MSVSDQLSTLSETSELIDLDLSAFAVDLDGRSCSVDAYDADSYDADAHDPAVLASKAGYTGTLAGFIAWLSDAVTYGSVTFDPVKITNPYGRWVYPLTTVTGGWSNDERLLARVQSSVLSGAWESSHRGGLTVYLIPADWLASETEIPWLAPEGEMQDCNVSSHLNETSEAALRQTIAADIAALPTSPLHPTHYDASSPGGTAFMAGVAAGIEAARLTAQGEA